MIFFFVSVFMFNLGYLISKLVLLLSNIFLVYVLIVLICVFGIGCFVFCYIECLMSYNWVL